MCLDEERGGEEERRLRVVADAPCVARLPVNRELQEERKVNQERHDKNGDVSDDCFSDVNHTGRSEGVTYDKVPFDRDEDYQPSAGEEEEVKEGSLVGEIVGAQDDPWPVGWHSGMVP